MVTDLQRLLFSQAELIHHTQDTRATGIFSGHSCVNDDVILPCITKRVGFCFTRYRLHTGNLTEFV